MAQIYYLTSSVGQKSDTGITELQSRCFQSCIPCGGSRGKLFSCFSQFLETSHISWFLVLFLHLHSQQHRISLTLFLSLHLFSDLLDAFPLHIKVPRNYTVVVLIQRSLQENWKYQRKIYPKMGTIKDRNGKDIIEAERSEEMKRIHRRTVQKRS